MTTEEYVEAYMDAVKAGWTMRQFADSLAQSYNTVASRRRYLVRVGVKLPGLKSGKIIDNDLNVEKLNKIIQGA